METVDYISLGPDCNSSIACRNLGLRKHAYPFDWVVANANAIVAIIENNFEDYHANLHMNWNRWIKNKYEIEFPNDYDTKTTDDGWKVEHEEVREKYERRIERFHQVMNKTTPLVILLGHTMSDVIRIKQTIGAKYNRKNVYYIVKSSETTNDDYIFPMLNPHDNLTSEQWNDSELWRPTVEKVQKIIESRL
jgi:hypothetical protein